MISCLDLQKIIYGEFMKILVAVKRVLDYNVKARVKADQTGIDLANVKMSMNPFDEIAVEEAVRLKEAGQATEIIAVSIGTLASQETLRTALALGADGAILVETEEDLEPLAVSKVLKTIVEQEKPDLVILGKQAIDNDANQTGQMLSALLGWSQGTFISELQVEADSFLVTREVDGGLESLRCARPAILTTDLRLNEPRYPKLPNIMKAKKKPLDIIALSTLNIDTSPRQKVLKVSEPPVRAGGIKVSDVPTLIKKLAEEAKVI